MLMTWCSACMGKGYLMCAESVDQSMHLVETECPHCEGSGLERDSDDNPRFRGPNRVPAS